MIFLRFMFYKEEAEGEMWREETQSDAMTVWQ